MSEDDYAAFVTPGAVPRPRRSASAAWRELSARQARLVERLARARARSASRPRAPTCACASSGRTWINSDGRRNMPSGEVFTGPLEDSAQRHDPLHHPVEPARGRGRRRRADASHGGEVVAARAERGQDYLERRARDRRRGAPPRRARDRHQPRDRPRHRLDPARREDRRHRPPGARPLLPGDRRHERLGAALGPDLRPARAAAG